MGALLAAAFLAWPAAFHTGCEGGTTGVDNPGLAELPVEFRDEAGDRALVQGTLEIYDREHNPAVDSEPLLRIGIANDTGLRLTPVDFERIDSARGPRPVAANWKRSAAHRAGAAAGPSGTYGLIRFNLVFRSGSGAGAVATGLSYDPVRKVFGLDPGGEAPAQAAPNGIGAVRMLPKPLIRFAARIHREAIAGEAARIFLPGTPFQATLVDSDFALQNLPEGRFGMRVLGEGGYVYAVRETLDTRTAQTFSAAPEPIGRVDASIAPVGFAVDAGGLLYANAQESTVLQGMLLGADPADSRISILWRLLRPQSADSVRIDDPTRLDPRILFPTAGSYALELSATLGGGTVRDTVQFKVAPATVPATAKFTAPQAGDSLKQGVVIKVGLDSPISGLARLEYNYKDGAAQSWVPAADSVAVAPGGTLILWTTPMVGTVAPCLLRVRMIPSDSLLAQTPAPYFLVP